VAVRVRPKLKHEFFKDTIVQCHPHSIKISDYSHLIESKYDRIFTQESLQQDVYSFVTEQINQVFEGINTTIFAYG